MADKETTTPKRTSLDELNKKAGAKPVRKRKTPEQQLQALKVREKQLKAKIQAKNAAAAKQARKDRTRRHIVGGSICETHALMHPDSDWAKTYWRLIGEETRPQDRKLFDEVTPK